MSRTKTVLVWTMGIFYVAAGVMHFARPDFYAPMMPPYPSSASVFSSSTVTWTLADLRSFAASCTAAANFAGVRSAAGVFTQSRASAKNSASPTVRWIACRSRAGPA